jgi:bacterioferritin (cytochrome b1)
VLSERAAPAGAGAIKDVIKFLNAVLKNELTAIN